MRASALVFTVLVGLAAWSCEQYAQLKVDVSKEISRFSKPAVGGADAAWERDDGADGGATLVEDPHVACALPLHKDDYFGFSIGFSAGWHLDYTTGSIVVAKDPNELVGAMVYPARLRKEVPAEDVATAFARGLGGTITQRGGTFEITDKHTNGKIARATLKATVGGVALRGPLEVVEKPGFVTVKLYWAPEDDFDAEKATLKQVVACFQRKTLVTARKPVAPTGGPVTRYGAGAPAASGGSSASSASSASGASGVSGSSGPAQAPQPYHGKFYDAAMPAGWKLTDETGYGIDMISGDGSMGVGFGLVIVALKNAQTFTQADQVRGITKIWPGVRITQWGRVPGPPGTTSFGAEFEGTPHGVPVHGYSQDTFVGRMQTSISYTTAPEHWAANKPTMAAVAASVRIQASAYAKESADRRAQLAEYARLYPPPKSTTPSSSSGSDGLMSSWKARQDAQDRMNLGFDDAIRGQDRALSPTTGEEYVVPNSAWSTEGPAGPGYYRALPGGGSELLNVEQTPGGTAPM